MDGKDLIIDLAGGFKDIYIQVKCALGVNRDGRVRGTVRMHRERLSSDPKFVYIFCILDRRKMELTRIWVVPAAAFYKHAYRTVLSNGMVQYNFDCRVAGDKRWDQFEVIREELGPRLVDLINTAHRRRRARPTRRGLVAGSWLRFVA